MHHDHDFYDALSVTYQVQEVTEADQRDLQAYLQAAHAKISNPVLTPEMGALLKQKLS